MEVRFGNRKRIRFSDKKHPKHGIISVVLGVLSIIILLTLCIVSGHAKGRAGMEIGALGLATMVLSIIGFDAGGESCEKTGGRTAETVLLRSSKTGDASQYAGTDP